MEISFIGLLVCAGIWLFGRLYGSALIIGLIVSVAFGSTSAMTLSALGGSSPLIYFVFAAAFVTVTFVEKQFAARLRLTFQGDWVPWAICAIAIYAAVGAYIMPRLFAGETNAFITARDTGVVEVSLTPNSGNITQTGYFVLGALTSIALLTRLRGGRSLETIQKAFLIWASVNALGGAIDLGAKLVGAGDLFLPIRTASFAFLTDDGQAGFARINGLYSEASAFANAALASLAFTYTLWRHGGSWFALVLTALLLVLLLLSTSSTAYAGLAVLAVPVCASLVSDWVNDRFAGDSALILLCVACGTAVVLFIIVYDRSLLDPVQTLFQVTILDKSQSESGRERGHWNERSLASLVDTWGWGIGFGSSRASNWLVAVLSQLGFLGTALLLSLLIPFFRRPEQPPRSSPQHKLWVLHSGLRACALTSLLGGIISGGNADPGLLFFVALAGTLACQNELALGNAAVSVPPIRRGTVATVSGAAGA